jgi:hypothetical protein
MSQGENPSASEYLLPVQRGHPSLLFLLLAVIILATLGRAGAHEFVDWDDKTLLADNPKFNHPTWRSALGYVSPRNADENLYIPATQLFWSLIAAIGHTDHPDPGGSLLNPWAFHCANLGLHIASAGVVFAFLRRFATDGAAWIGAVVFAIHPVQVETVAWASGGRDLLSGLFGFICLYQLVRSRQSDQPGERRGRWIIATLTAALAMLAKPSAVALPLEALAVDVVLVRTRLMRSLISLSPWFLCTIPVILITHHVQPMLWPTHTAVLARPVIALDSIAFYITKLIWPIHLVFDYGRTPAFVLEEGWRAFWMVPLLLGLLLLWKGKRLPRVLAGTLLAVAAIVPVLGLVSFMAQDYSTVSDHYLYPSMLGVALIIAAIAQVAARRFGKTAAYTMALLVAALLAFQSFTQVSVWSNSFTLFSNAIRANPRSSNAHAGYGYVLLDSGDEHGAVEQFQIAEQLNSHNGMAIMGLANLLLRAGDMDGAALQYGRLMQVYQMQPNFDPRMGAAGEMVVAARLIQRGDTAGAIAALEQARQWDPTNPRIAALLFRARAAPSTHPANAWQLGS